MIFTLFNIEIIAQYKTELYVAVDGTGDYTSIQKAIDDTKCFPNKRITIFIKSGTYDEKVKLHSWNSNVTLRGENTETTIITWSDCFDLIDRGRNSTFHTATLLIEGDNTKVENLTIINAAGEVGQAVALAVIADRVSVKNCKIIGHQDSLYAAGSNARQWYYRCHIEGTTDFIFGEATAYFESCTIHSKKDSYITAASTPLGRKFGFVFYDCTLTAAIGVTQVYLGRPWRDYAKTAFIGCTMDDHIVSVGWDNWSESSTEKTTFFAEYGNKGPGANISNRVAWSHQLSKKEAKKYSKQNVLDSFSLSKMETD